LRSTPKKRVALPVATLKNMANKPTPITGPFHSVTDAVAATVGNVEYSLSLTVKFDSFDLADVNNAVEELRNFADVRIQSVQIV